jgi:hypothetical protein
MLTFGVVVLHDSARLHTVARPQALFEHFNWEFFDHPPYSLDLAPSDHHLFTYLKKWLRSQRFNKLCLALLCIAVEHSVHASSNTVPLFAISLSQMSVQAVLCACF